MILSHAFLLDPYRISLYNLMFGAVPNQILKYISTTSLKQNIGCFITVTELSMVGRLYNMIHPS